MKYYLIERHNPQFSKPYYIKQGQLSKKDAKKLTAPGYGYNNAVEFETEEEYNKAILGATANGFRVH
ncbi:MAG: hypothetical protein ABIP51_18075 [Bacteroidia bacterium]